VFTTSIYTEFNKQSRFTGLRNQHTQPNISLPEKLPDVIKPSLSYTINTIKKDLNRVVKRFFYPQNNMKNVHYKRYKKRYKEKSGKIKPARIKPGSDSKLKKIFKMIGTPPEKDFKPDSFQVDAVEAIRSSDCLVTAPTGSGKTWIAEEAVTEIMLKGGRSWYGTPLKALSNTIYKKFSDKFGSDHVGILTGDKKENSEAEIIIGTTEILRNQLYDAMHKGVDLETDLVILDEAHFLGDEDRGVVWEEIMIYLPPRIPILLLSATIGNAHQIADWLTSIRGRTCVIIEESVRPVPLYPIFFHPAGTLFPLLVKDEENKRETIYKKVVKFMDGKIRPAISRPGRLAPMGEIIKVLSNYNLLPAIFFLKSRADCDAALELCTSDVLFKDPERKEKISKRIGELVKKNKHIGKHKQLQALEHLAVGSHHSGQLPAWKVIVETLMAEGLLDAMFATSTVAAGVDFPARTVVMFNSDRYNGVDFQPLDSTKLQQMTGRAGRRGKDNIGFAVIVPGKFMDIRLVPKLFNAPPVHILSQIKIDFSMVLNLLLSHNPSEIKKLLTKSFASFQMVDNKKKKKNFAGFTHTTDYLWRDFQQHLKFLVEEDFVKKSGALASDGLWASKLRVDSPLLVAEGFRLGVFPQKDPVLLAAIMATFVNEREFKEENLDRTKIDKGLYKSFNLIRRILKPFALKMQKKGFEVKPLYLQPAATIFLWASGMTWEKVVRLSGLAEGDLARLVLRTADHLRHLRGLKSVFPDAAATSLQSIDLIMKEPIVSYYD